MSEIPVVRIPEDLLKGLAPAANTPWLVYGEAPARPGDLPYPKAPEVTAAQKEAFLEGDVIFSHDGIDIVHPANPFINETEEQGLHLRIIARDIPGRPKTAEDWRRWHEAWAMAFGAGKVGTEGQRTKFLWQNFINRTDFPRII
jgi:hypothetical protein